jgi:hypothetical protein
MRHEPREFDEEEEEEEEEETNKAGLELPEDTIENVPGLPERPSTPPQRKRTHTLVLRTPTKASNSSSTSFLTSFNPHRRRPIRALYIYCAS